jgi:hypothetical protein
MGSLPLIPTLNLEDQELHFVWSLPFVVFGMGGSTRNLRSRQHSSPAHWAVVFEEWRHYILHLWYLLNVNQPVFRIRRPYCAMSAYHVTKYAHESMLHIPLLTFYILFII